MIKSILRLKVIDFELQAEYDTIYGIAVYKNTETNLVYWQFISKFSSNPTMSDEDYVALILQGRLMP